MFDFYTTFKNELARILIVDVGAMALGAGTNVFEPLLKYDNCHVIGFEPVHSECEKLNNKSNKNRRYLPYFIGDGSDRTFHLCNNSMTSSLYQPNIELLNKFQNLAELCMVKENFPVSTKKLDDIEEVRDADFIKIDVQGAELDVFKGASNILREVLVIHTEVEFLPLYIDQPLFADIDQHLRSNGFQFHKFATVAGRTLKPLVANKNINRSMSQQLWADAVYIKDILSCEKLPLAKIVKLAFIMHEVYRAYDFSHYALQQYDTLTGNCYAGHYREALIQEINAPYPKKQNQ